MKLIRYEEQPGRTFGVLVVANLLLHTIERPWLFNKRSVSCIPPGIYETSAWTSRRLNEALGGKCIAVTGCEPARTLIRFHIANLAEQLEGCIGVGMARGYVKGYPAVLDSTEAMRRLLACWRPGQALEIVDATGMETRRVSAITVERLESLRDLLRAGVSAVDMEGIAASEVEALEALEAAIAALRVPR